MLFGGSPTPCIRVTAFLPHQTTGCQLLSYSGARALAWCRGLWSHIQCPMCINPSVPVLSKLPDACARGAAPSLHQCRAPHSPGCSAGANHAKEIRQVCRSLIWCHEEQGGRGSCGQTGTLYIQIDTYIYAHTYIYTYICTCTHRHMGCTKHCSEFLPALWAKSNALPCIGGSANIHIFIRELMQEKIQRVQEGWGGEDAPCRGWEALTASFLLPASPPSGVSDDSGARVFPCQM